MNATDAENAQQETDAAIIDRRRLELRDRVREHYRWYDRAKVINRTLYYLFYVVSIILGFGATAVSALDPDAFEKGGLTRATIILAPLTVAFLTTCIQQFGWREMYETREQARIDVEELLLITKQTRPSTIDGMTTLEVETHRRLIEISRSQATGFFSALSRNTEASNQSLSDGANKS